MMKVQSRSVTDPGDIAVQTRGDSCRATPLRPHPFLLHTSNLDLSGLTLQTGGSTPLAVLGAVPPETSWLLLPLDGRGTLLLGGRTAGACGVAVFGAGADYEMADRNDGSWGWWRCLRQRSGRSFHRRAGRRSAGPGPAVWLHADTGAWVRAASLMRDAAAVMVADPDVFEIDEARRSLRDALLDVCYDLLAGPHGGAVPRALAAASSSLRRVVRAADDCLSADPARAFDTAQLSKTVGVSETQLRSAFLAVLGISAARYLLLRRLVLARAGLHSPDCRWGDTQAAARAYGFWNCRGFERAYRIMFGEAPFGR
ncbi:helix-turn-helix domain-containing protein [Dankookia sp. P2]|uniref:helix-turn-helix domain-containing protein n=1 Tax=Dankookia sp. P2 TaxID=3423955 RepID=UPI003D669A0C